MKRKKLTIQCKIYFSVFFIAKLISIEETFDFLPSSLVTASVPISICLTSAFVKNRLCVISAASTALLIAFPLAFITTSVKFPEFQSAIIAVT